MQKSKSQFKIQKFKKEQVEQICGLLKKSFNEFVASSFSSKARKNWLLEITPENFIKISQQREREIYTAIQNNRIIGVIAGNCKTNRVSLLFVNKKFHRKGVAKKLMEKIESIFKKRRAKIIKVRSSLYAEEFYKKMGYKKSTGLIKTKDGKTYQPMKKIL